MKTQSSYSETSILLTVSLSPYVCFWKCGVVSLGKMCRLIPLVLSCSLILTPVSHLCIGSGL